MSNSPQARSPSNVPEATAQARILIVEDHVDSADIIAEVLSAYGHETTAVYDPFEAVTVAVGFQPDITILAVDLPGVDGYALCAQLARAAHDCRFIALTGAASESSARFSQWVGFDGYLTKPIAVDTLVTTVAAVHRAKQSPSGIFPLGAKSAWLRLPTERPKRERSRVDLFESPEVVRYWTTELCCTEAQLRAAVADVGIAAEAVRQRLAARR